MSDKATIPTAEQFIRNHFSSSYDNNNERQISLEDCFSAMNDFAKLHLEALTEEIKEKIISLDRTTDDTDQTSVPYANAEYNLISEPIDIVEQSISETTKNYIETNLK